MEFEHLKDLGLTDSEIKVYLALLDLGDSSRGAIVAKSGIAGSKVYEILEKLHAKGLVAWYVHAKIKHFKPTHPSQIMTYLEEKKSRILETEKKIASFLPELLSRFDASKEDQEVEILSGIKGLRIIFKEQLDIMKSGETCYVIGGTRGSNEDAVWAFFVKIHDMRNLKGIRTKMLFNESQRGIVKNFYSSKKYKLTQTRYLSHGSPVATNVYKDRTVIIVFGKSISIIHIKSQEVAHSFLEYFNMLWDQAKN